MAEAIRRTVWGYRGLYVVIAGLLIFVRLLPIDTLPARWPGPDLLLCFTFAWVLRRPDYVPAWLIAAVVLLEGFLTMRPPGLWAAIVVVGSEFLRARIALTREVGFVVEWLMVSVVMVAAFFAYRLVLLVAFLPLPGFAMTFAQVAVSVLAYPLAVAVSALLLGLRKTAPGEVDSLGRPL